MPQARYALLYFLATPIIPVTTTLPPEAPPVSTPDLADAPVAPGETMPSEVQLPVQLTDTEQARGLRLAVQRSLLKNYGDSFSYTLHATLGNAGDELHRLRMKLELLDADGTVLLTEYADVRQDYQPYLRPGESAPLAHLVYEETAPPAAHDVRLSVDIAERQPAATDYGAPTTLSLMWRRPRPAHLDFVVYERDSRITDGIRERMHFLTLSATNQGTRPVQGLRVKVTWYDARDNELTSELTYIVPSTGPALQPGETWVAQAIGKFPLGREAPFAYYDVSILEME